jgi:signal transduction histidine kinase
MKSLRFSSKLHLAFGSLAVLATLIAIVAVIFVRQSSREGPSNLGTSVKVARLVTMIMTERSGMDQTLERLALGAERPPNARATILDQSYDRLATLYYNTRSLSPDPWLQQILDQIQDSQNVLRPIEQRILQAATAQNSGEAGQLYSREYLPARAALQRALYTLSEFANQLARNAAEDSQSRSNLASGTVIGLTILTILLAGGLSIYLSRALQLPIQSLTYVASAITAGELNHTLSLGRADEFGEMAESLNQMVINLRRMNKDLADQIKTLRETRGELAYTQNQLALQETMMQQEKMAALGRLVAGVAHELNNPISFVYSNTVLLNKSLADLKALLEVYDSRRDLPEEAARAIAKVKQQIDYAYLMKDISGAIADCHDGARRVRDIVLNLKTFSRADQSQPQTVSITAVIQSTIRMLSQYFRNDRVTLNCEFGDVPDIECYPGQLSQVWMNLLVNAAQAIEDRGNVWLTTSVEGEFLVVRVRDEGPGIPEELITRIFDPFFTTKPVGEGTGLGLSIVHGIIERHGGDIRVESTVGIGTTFTVRLPLTRTLLVEETEEEPEGALV